MKKSYKVVISIAVVLALSVGTGAVILAASNYGTESDPLVTLSYLNEKFRPALISDLAIEINKIEQSALVKLEQRLRELDMTHPTAAPTATATETFELVTLTEGQTVKCSVGTELLLRIGTAEGVGSSPALVDSTSGAALGPGAALEANHMYMATIADNGFKAVSATVKVLIRGDYTVA